MQSLFFSPKAPTAAGLIWGVGPAFQIPTATDNIANNQWLAGVTGVALRQSGPWTVGALANHLWSVSGNDKFGDVSATFLQPFVRLHDAQGDVVLAEHRNRPMTGKTRNGRFRSTPRSGRSSRSASCRSSSAVGARYWADAPEFGPDGWGGRFQVTLLFPK